MESAWVPDTQWIQAFRRRLLRWYRRNRRDLPWRGTRDPYAIWVSEVMLQQTQVVTVQPYYHRFMKRFPDAATLAAADETEVLRMWEGLGYYRRARQLHSAAKALVKDFDGQFPRRADDARLLPGVGRYTAGAILSIAFDAREPVLEGNTTRLLTRLIAYREDPRGAAGQKVLWKLAEDLLPQKNSGTLNQALMELGSQVCTPRTPDCPSCPVANSCEAFALRMQEQLPAFTKRIRYEDVHEIAAVVRRRGRVLLRRCGESERWAGLWDFPRFAAANNGRRPAMRELSKRVKELTGFAVKTGNHLTTIKHGVTRFRITLECYEAVAERGPRLLANGDLRWVRPGDLVHYPLSVTGRRISRLLTASR